MNYPLAPWNPAKKPLATAIRELQEEVGHLPVHVRPMGGFYVAPGYTTEYIHLFVCSGLEPSPLDGDEDEDIEVEALSLQQALAAIEAGEICDGKSIVGILRWANSNR